MASPFDDIFGGSGPQWTREQIISRIRGEADRQKVDPDLAVAVATQESSLDPDNHGDKGRSRGVFHLQERAAIDAGIDPRWRDDPGVNIYGGVRYLKQKLDQSKGNVEQALSRYNRGTPDYRGIGDPDYVYHVLRHYPDHPLGKAPANPEGYAARLKKTFGVSLGPRSAEAATPQQAASPWDDIFGAQTPTQAPAPPTATSTPEQDAAYRSSRGQQAPATAPQTAPAPTTQPEASQAPPAPPPDPSATPGMRFQALPSITQLEPADRIQKTRDFERLKPALQEEFLRSEEPTAGGLALQRFLALPSIASLDPPEREAAIADFQAMQPTQQEEVIKMERPGYWQQTKRLGVPDEAPVTEGITAPSTMIPLLMPGAGVKAVAPLLGKAGPLITRGARAAAEGLSQTAGWTAGRTAETGQVPSPGEIGTEAALNVGTGGALEIPGALLRKPWNAALRATPGGQTLLSQEAVKEAQGLGKRVFSAQDREVVTKAFDAVRATGEKLDTSPVRTLWQSLTPAEQRIAGNELNKISSTFADALKTKKLGDWDIGDLQHVQSELRKASLVKRTPETIDLLHSMRSSVQEAIHNGMAKGSLPAAELVAAQKAYRKVMQADDLQGLVTKHTKDSPNLKWQELNLAALNKEIRGGGRKKVQELVKGMDATEREVLQQETESLKRHYPFVRITPTVANLTDIAIMLRAGGKLLEGDLAGAATAALPMLFTAAIRSPTIMSMLKSSIIESKGQLTSRHIDTLINAIRHENEGEAPAQ